MEPLTIQDLEADLAAAICADDGDLIASLGAAMDTLEANTRRTPPGSLPAALWYASKGLKVFPLHPGAKTPYRGSHGFEDASSQEDQVRALFDGKPDANIGIATGHLVDVIDIDGPRGQESLARELLDDHGNWSGPPIFGRVSTPRPGGCHLYVAADPDRTNRAAMLPGIDTRALGGYVVAPPSTTDLGRYIWVEPLTIGD